ncbi:hypothetical protein OS493_031438 [Desmophyllum pertusum]|uniref:Uncharacterized protein n=1 Tax=Desmophyllum pertusum TaxID=174260 RepID=A0A9X0A0M0_9CNID|nr:hypothetical protein OS493_031438 [Desmophyllum pertusum]
MVETFLPKNEIQRDVVRALVDMQRKLQLRIQELSSTLERLYEKEVQRLLQHQSHCEALCANDKAQPSEEIGTFIGFLNIGLETQDLSDIDVDGIFSALPTIQGRGAHSFLMFWTLYCFTKLMAESFRDASKKCSSFSCPFGQLEKSKIQNDLKVMFTCLCISLWSWYAVYQYAESPRSHSKLGEGNEVFDSRKAKKQEEILKQTPVDLPVILMFDNINMYRGKHKHLRLFKYIGPHNVELYWPSYINSKCKWFRRHPARQQCLPQTSKERATA